MVRKKLKLENMILAQTSNGIKWITHEKAEEMYLDYVNNFLTLSKFAEYYGISYVTAQRIYKTFKN